MLPTRHLKEDVSQCDHDLKTMRIFAVAMYHEWHDQRSQYKEAKEIIASQSRFITIHVKKTSELEREREKLEQQLVVAREDVDQGETEIVNLTSSAQRWKDSAARSE